MKRAIVYKGLVPRRRASDRSFGSWLCWIVNHPNTAIIAQGLCFVAGCVLLGLILFAVTKGAV